MREFLRGLTDFLARFITVFGVVFAGLVMAMGIGVLFVELCSWVARVTDSGVAGIVTGLVCVAGAITVGIVLSTSYGEDLL